MYFRKEGLTDHEIYFDYSENKTEELREIYDKVKYFFNNFEKTSKKERYELLKNYMSFEFESDDVLEIINDVTNGDSFTKIVDIPSKIETSFVTSEGSGRDFSWWEEFRQHNFICASTKDFEVGEERKSSDELISLYNEGIIYPLYRYGKNLFKFSPDKEDYTNIPSAKDVGIVFESERCFPKYNQYSINFKDEGKEYLYNLFDKDKMSKESEIEFYKAILDELHWIIYLINHNCYFDEEKKMARTMARYYYNKKSKVEK